MKYIIVLILYSSTLLYCSENFIIRNAQTKDLEKLNDISKQYDNDYFSPLWKNFCAQHFPSTNNDDNESSDQTKHVMIAESNNAKAGNQEIVGYCGFRSKNEQTIYVNFILIDKKYKKRGIAKKFAMTIVETFKKAMIFKFQALADDQGINDIYIRNSCRKASEVSLAIHTDQINNDPNARITYVDYESIIKR